MQKMFAPVEWILRSNIYEVNVRQYTREGTFNAFSSHLSRLHDMGIEILWFMPVTPISKEVRQGTLGSYYACSDYKSVNPEFGTLEDFIRLVDKAHSLGLKVIIDWVANHTGWDHTWTKTNPEFYKRNAAGQFYDTNNWHDVIDLNYYDQSMRKEMVAAMEFWIRSANIDGFRCDMAHLVPLDFWRQARTHLDEIKSLMWLAETEHLNYQSAFDVSYAWHWMHQTEAFCKGKIDVPALTETLYQYLVKSENHLYLFFTTNHDENSWNGTEYEKYGKAAAPLAVLTCTIPGNPLIYSGQEIPNTKRLKFFDKDEIRWDSKIQLHDFYKTLLQLRKQNVALISDSKTSDVFLINHSLPKQVISYLRKNGEKEVLTVINLSAHHADCILHSDHVNGTYREIFTRQQHLLHAGSVISMAAWGFLVFER